MCPSNEFQSNLTNLFQVIDLINSYANFTVYSVKSICYVHEVSSRFSSDRCVLRYRAAWRMTCWHWAKFSMGCLGALERTRYVARYSVTFDYHSWNCFADYQLIISSCKRYSAKRKWPHTIWTKVAKFVNKPDVPILRDFFQIDHHRPRFVLLCGRCSLRRYCDTSFN